MQFLHAIEGKTCTPRNPQSSISPHLPILGLRRINQGRYKNVHQLTSMLEDKYLFGTFKSTIDGA
jgi:hypothetical protein